MFNRFEIKDVQYYSKLESTSLNQEDTVNEYGKKF